MLEPSAINCGTVLAQTNTCAFYDSNLVDVLALELLEESVETLIISLSTDGGEDILDVAGGRRGVSTKSEKKVGSKVLHCVRLENRSAESRVYHRFSGIRTVSGGAEQERQSI